MKVINAEQALSHGAGVLLERAAVATRYLAGCLKFGQDELNYLVRTCMDYVEVQKASIWTNTLDGNWECLVKTSPNDSSDMFDGNRENHLNLESIHAGRVIDIELDEYEGSGFRYLVASCAWPGNKYLTLHLLGRFESAKKRAVHNYLTLIVNLLMAFNFFDIDGRGKRNGRNPAAGLSRRQLEILTYMASPMSYRRIADQMGYSESTVKQEVSRIFRFLNVESRSDAVEKAKSLPEVTSKNERGHDDG